MTSYSRRRILSILAAGGATAAVASVPAMRLLGGDDGPVAVDLLTATAETFRPHIGSPFTAGGQTLTLTDVTSLAPHAYHLTFRGPAASLRDGTYEFASRRVRPFHLFVVTGAVDADGTSYGASINHEVV